MGGQARGIGWAAGLLLCLQPAMAGAATIIETDGSDSNAAILYVSDDAVRVESAAQSAHVTLFSRSAGELVFVNHNARQYQRVGREEMRRIAESVERTREQMKRQIEEMPPEQRERMRERLAEMPGGDEPSGIRIERRGSGTIAGIACQEAMVHLNDKPSHAVCVASAEDIGLSQPAFRTLDEMFAFFGEMTGGMSEGHGELGPRTTSEVIRELDGIPVRSEAVESESSWAVTAVRETDVPAERFRVPPEYEEVDPVARDAR